MPLAASAAAAVLVLGGPVPARADYKDSYKKGLEAAARKNWPEVIRLMREAAGEQPREGEQIKLYGVRFETYLPHYQLGMALFRSGDCRAALAEWEISQGQGVIRKLGSEYKELTQGQNACQTQLAEHRAPSSPAPPPEEKPKPAPSPAAPAPALVAQASQAAEAEIVKADEAARAVAALAVDPLLAPGWAQDASLGGSERQAKETLAAARAKAEVGKAKPDIAQLAEAKDMAARAAQQLDGVRREAASRQEEARKAAERKQAEDAARRAAASLQPPTLATLPSPVPRASEPPRGEPPLELVQAAQAYFDADYKTAVDILDRKDFQAPRALVQARLFRAAARYALFLVGAGKEDGLRRAALEDLRALRKLDPAFRPDPQVFSPRFTEFFDKSR